MDQYIVNGVEIAYDTFDLENLEVWEEEARRVSDVCAARVAGESSMDAMHRVCEAMRDFFDQVCGEGTARTLFGERTNVKAIYDGYRAFTSDVNAAVQEYTAQMQQPAPANRAQRRAAERGR